MTFGFIAQCARPIVSDTTMDVGSKADRSSPLRSNAKLGRTSFRLGLEAVLRCFASYPHYAGESPIAQMALFHDGDYPRLCIREPSRDSRLCRNEKLLTDS